MTNLVNKYQTSLLLKVNNECACQGEKADLPLPENKRLYGSIADRARFRYAFLLEIGPIVSSRIHKLGTALKII
jgi:hypothetical protein